MTGAQAFAKINLALVVGPLRADGKHEIVTVLQRIDLHDDVELERTSDGDIVVEGFPDDTLVHQALQALAESAASGSGWRARIENRVPVAAGLGGGSSDAAAALLLANAMISKPLAFGELHELAARIGADVPFFLRDGPQLAAGDGSDLSPLELPLDFVVLLVLPGGERKESTATVYRRFDERACANFERRRDGGEVALVRIARVAEQVNPGRDGQMIAHRPSPACDRAGCFPHSVLVVRDNLPLRPARPARRSGR